MTALKILIVEDDPDIAYLLDRSLKREGYTTEIRPSGNRILDTIRSLQPDLVLLDIMLPGMNGFDICRIVKEASLGKDLKVIMLTSKAEEDDVLVGFRSGADDFIPKPFHMQEVLARVKAVLRRHESSGPSHKKRHVQQGPISIDDIRHEVRIHGEPLNLTISEYRLLHLMASQPDRVYTREQLSDSISDSERSNGLANNSRNIDVHIRSLRKKLGENAHLICTLRGVGYYFLKQAPGKASLASGL